MNYRPIVYINGLLLCLLALVMLLPALVDAAMANLDWQAFAMAAMVTGFVGGLLCLAARQDARISLNRREAFVLVASAWLGITAFAALPFLGLGLTYSAALFESASGLTTTGSTVLVGLDFLPKGILLWRALMQWFGGVGIIVMAIAILPFLRIGGMQLFRIETSGDSEKIEPRAILMIVWIVVIYAGLTLLCMLTYWNLGMTPFDALCHAMTTLSTGGFSTHDASLGYFHSLPLLWAGSLFMLSGALPFVSYLKFIKGKERRFWRDPQISGLLWLLLLASILATDAAFDEGFTPFAAMSHGVFNVISVVTTTGFASDDYSLWGPEAIGLFFVLTFCGGAAGSTTGAIKIYRFQLLWIMVKAQLARLVSPSRVVVAIYNGRVVTDEVLTAVLAFLALFLGTVTVFTLVLSFLGLDLVTALSASVTALSNVGPGLGPIIGPAGHFGTMPQVAQWVLAFAMLAGRLEILSLLIMFDPRFWRF